MQLSILAHAPALAHDDGLVVRRSVNRLEVLAELPPFQRLASIWRGLREFSEDLGEVYSYCYQLLQPREVKTGWDIPALQYSMFTRTRVPPLPNFSAFAGAFV